MEPEQIVSRLEASGVRGMLVGRGAFRNPWIFSQAAALARGEAAPSIPPEARGDFLLEYIDLLLQERCDEAPGFRHTAAATEPNAGPPASAKGRQRWVINKLRALGSWYTKGMDGGSHLRVAINSAESIDELRGLIRDFFYAKAALSGR